MGYARHTTHLPPPDNPASGQPIIGKPEACVFHLVIYTPANHPAPTAPPLSSPSLAHVSLAPALALALSFTFALLHRPQAALHICRIVSDQPSPRASGPLICLPCPPVNLSTGQVVFGPPILDTPYSILSYRPLPTCHLASVTTSLVSHFYTFARHRPALVSSNVPPLPTCQLVNRPASCPPGQPANCSTVQLHRGSAALTSPTETASATQLGPRSSGRPWWPAFRRRPERA